MYRIITSFFVTLFLFTTPALAEKPEWAGKGKPTKKKSDKSSKSEKSEKSKSEKDSEEKVKGLEKQKLKKTDQQMKELDKGSDQGQESRDNRKKWWRFWD